MNELVLAKRPLIFSEEAIYGSLPSLYLSLFVDVDHAEGCRLVSSSLVLNSKDHHFVPWEAVALLLGDLQYQGD